MAHLIEKGLKPTSIDEYIRAIKTFLHFLFEEGSLEYVSPKALFIRRDNFDE